MSLTDAARLEAYARTSDAAWFLCVTINHALLAEPIRLCANNEDITRAIDGNPEVFKAFPFDMILPGDDPDNPSRVSAVIYDAEGEITKDIRGLRPAPSLTGEYVVSKAVDVVEHGPFVMTLKERDAVDGQFTADFGFEDILDDAYPGDTTTNATNPGLFA